MLFLDISRSGETNAIWERETKRNRQSEFSWRGGYLGLRDVMATYLKFEGQLRQSASYLWARLSVASLPSTRLDARF